MNEPQTIDQFRDFCKVLKFKIKKQKETIDGLEEKNKNLSLQCESYKRNLANVPTANKPQEKTTFARQGGSTPEPPKRDEIIATDLKGKDQIMKVLKDGANRIGISPQSIFRIADIHYRNVVEYDHFRNTLSKMNLGLTPKEISSLIYIFDENCNSFIAYHEFIETLQGYQIAEENKENSKAFKHICLEKVSGLINADQINVESFYTQMDSRKEKSVGLNAYEEQMKKVFEGRIQEKEIIGSFYAMDLERNDSLDRQNFVYGINSSIRKVATMGPTRINEPSSSQINQQQQPPNQSGTPGNTGHMLSMVNTAFDRLQQSAQKNPSNNNESRMSIVDNPLFTNIESVINVKIPLESLSAPDILAKLKQELGITLASFYEELCRSSMERRTTLFNFRKTATNLLKGQKVDMNLISSLFKLIDFKQKGSIHFAELIYFYLRQSSDTSMVLRLMGKYFFNNDLNCEKYWFLFGISPDSDISKHRFLEVMSKTFEGLEESSKLWEKFWAYFDKGRGVLPVAALSAEMSKYEIVDDLNS